MDVVLDNFRSYVNKIRLTNLVFHIGLDDVTLLNSVGVPIKGFPFHPFRCREQSSKVVCVEVVCDLSKLRSGRSVRPRQQSVGGRSSRRSVKVIAEFFLLLNPLLAEHIPFHPAISNLAG